MTERLTGRVVALDRAATPFLIGGVRVLTALLWLANIHWKVPPDFGEERGGGLYKFSASVTRNSPFAPFTWVTEELVLPNFRLFGWATLIIEVVIAMFLLIGYRTKLVALLGFVVSVPIFLSVLYYDRADEWSWAYFMMMGLHLLLIGADAGRHLGVDGVLERRHADPTGPARAIRTLGIVGTVVGLLGLYVARSVDFAGDRAKLLGSDAGFVDADDRLVRRWELKFLWFNPLWAILTVVFGVALIVGWRRVTAARVGVAGLAVMAVVVFALQTFDYERDDGALQVVSTGSNTAFWGALAVAGAVFARHHHVRRDDAARDGGPGDGGGVGGDADAPA